MNKIRVLSIILIMFVLLTSCSKQESPSEAILEEEIKPTVIAQDGEYITPSGMKLEIEEDWEVQESGTYAFVVFTPTEEAFIMFMDPFDLSEQTLDALVAEWAAETISGGLGEAPEIGEITQITVNGKDVWTVEVVLYEEGLIYKKLLFWVFQEEDAGYVCIFIAQPDYYDEYLPSAELVMASLEVV